MSLLPPGVTPSTLLHLSLTLPEQIILSRRAIGCVEEGGIYYYIKSICNSSLRRILFGLG